MGRHGSRPKNLDNQERQQQEQKKHADNDAQDNQAPLLTDMCHPGESETDHRQDNDEEPHPPLPESGRDPGNNDEGEQRRGPQVRRS